MSCIASSPGFPSKAQREGTRRGVQRFEHMDVLLEITVHASHRLLRRAPPGRPPSLPTLSFDKSELKSHIVSLEQAKLACLLLGYVNMFGFRWKQRILELEGDLKALRKDFQTLESYVDDRLRLVRNAENRIRVKSATIEENEVAETAPETRGNPAETLGRGLTPRESAILAISKRRRGLQ